jgi:hypothetical protein
MLYYWGIIGVNNKPMINVVAGYLSGIAILISFFPYIRDIFQGKTKPERISWLIWAILGAISFFSQFAKGASLFLWYVTREAAVALFIVIFIDAIGVYLTVLKTYENPETETVSTWIFTFAAGLLGCIAVGSFNLVLLAFPFYIGLAGAAILLAIKLGFWRKAQIKVGL